MKVSVMNSLRKWLLKPKRSDQSLLAKFYYADEELNAVASELDSFDGRKDTARCNSLVMKLRNRQDSVLTIVEQIMREIIPNSRARRDYRIKFPEEVLQESLAGQLWFGAECLAAGSSIVNKEIESMTMRPLAKSFTKQLDELRSLLREQCFRNLYSYTQQIKDALVNFDQLFADFELSYVSAMVPVKSTKDYDTLQDVTVLFCETVSRAMRSGLLNQDQFDSYDPLLMFTIPRLAIVCGLLIYPEGPLNPDQDPCQVSEMFRQQLTLLFKIRELLMTLDLQELNSLEKLICNPSSEHLLEEGSSTERNGARQSEESEEEEEEEDEEREVDEEEIDEADRSDRAARRFRENGTHSWPRGEERSEDLLSEEPMDENDGCRSIDPRLRRGTSLIAPVSTEATPGAVRSVMWKGSSEFNFCLPRNTGREVSWMEESMPYGLDSIQESSNLAWNGSVEAIPALHSGRTSSHSVNSCTSRQVTKTLQGSLSQPDQSYGTLQILDGPHVSHGADGQNPVLPLQNNLPSGHFHQSLETSSATRDCTDPRAPNHCSEVHPGNGRSSITFDPADASSGGLVAPLPCCSSKERNAPGEHTSPLHHRSNESNSSCDSMFYLEMEHDTISRIIQKARESAGIEARSKFKNSSDLVHQLFVCISKVADQLQTNFASDFRNILKATFECQSSSSCPCRTPDVHESLPSEEGEGHHHGGNDVDLTALDALEELVNTGPTACQEPFLAPVWLPDESSPNCMSCKVHFTFVRRRHHCRNCGKIFCSQCSSNYVPLPHIGHPKPVRACNACYIFHIIPFTNTS